MRGCGFQAIALSRYFGQPNRIPWLRKAAGMALKERIRAGIPMPVAIALGLAWAWVTWSDFNRQTVQPGEVDTEVVLR